MVAKNRVLVLLALVLAAAAYFHFDIGRRASLERGPKYHRTDFTVYQYAARALNAGDDPYEARNPRGYRYVYPPLLSVLLMPVAEWEPQHAALVFFVLSLLALLGALLALYKMADGYRPAIVAAAIVCLGFAHQGFQRGQVTHILLYIQVAALALLLGRRFVLAGLLLGIGGALRLTPLLPAAAVGLGLLVGAFKGDGLRPPIRLGLGVGLGLAIGLVLVPLAFLGPDRATDVTARWVEVTRDVYRDNADLEADYKINEWRFKNQAPRRVLGTWKGWIEGVPFEKERPVFSDPAAWRDVGRNGNLVAYLMLFLVVGFSALCLTDPGDRRFAPVYAAIVLVPVLMTRYTWPTHYLMAAPALVFAARPNPRSLPVVLLLGGALLFYAAHGKAFQVVGEAGCLMLACVAFLVVFLWRTDSDIGARYRRERLRDTAYRKARLAAGGFRRLAALFPKKGLIVDLGCGIGLLGHVLVEKNPERRVLAIDHDGARIAQMLASAEGLPIEARCEDMFTAEIPSCAGVAVIDVLHYLDANQQEALLRRAAMALEPGGVLVLRDPDASAWRIVLAKIHELFAIATGFTKARQGTYRTGEGWVALLESLGLEADKLPLRISPYPDRIVVGRKP